MQFLYQPIKPFRISQKFGDNQVCYFKSPDGSRIYKGKFTHEDCEVKYGAGWKSIYRRMRGHNGLDLYAKRWQPCYAMQHGTVLNVSTDENEGLGVVLRHDIVGKIWKTRSWHFIQVNSALKEGDKVKTGQLLGYCDSTGRSTGDHLHIDLKELNTDGTIKNYDNGYFGAVDPMLYMSDIFAPDVNKINKSIELAIQAIEKLTRIIRNLKK